jgi:DNA uptake protein ComE-like DNA-binding protein
MPLMRSAVVKFVRRDKFGVGVMSLIKSKYSVLFSAALLFALFASQQVAAAETATASAAAPAGMGPPPGAPQLTAEQRAKARAAAMENSAAARFNIAPLINPNTATKSQLAAIPGMTEARVQAVLAGRPFATPTALHAAIGKELTDAERFTIYSAMFVKVNLNKGELIDFELVPSTMAPKRLAHEFEEYRPYKAMADFSREMKKYVSEKEVAFLERFVAIN